MSLRHEQYRSLKYTRDFLRDLLATETRPKTVKETKERAWRCLKHFPFILETGKPLWSQDDLSEE